MSEAGHFERIGMVARWQPVHNGHAAVLAGLPAHADAVLVGIGSANRHNARNPFTLAERDDMLRLVLAGHPHVKLLAVDDLDDGPRWRTMVAGLFGPLDVFVTANPYVAGLMRDVYTVVHPVQFVAPDARVAVDGRQVRRLMAQGGDWPALVPEPVAGYIQAHGLDARFRRDYGLQTLALDALIDDGSAGNPPA